MATNYKVVLWFIRLEREIKVCLHKQQWEFYISTTELNTKWWFDFNWKALIKYQIDAVKIDSMSLKMKVDVGEKFLIRYHALDMKLLI